jgi:hypothetical protein
MFNICSRGIMRNIYEEQILSFRLNSGRRVELKSFHLDLTYHEWIEGVPDVIFNKETIQNMRPPDHWRKTAVLKILPEESLTNTFLPPFYCAGLFESIEDESSDVEGSQLIIMWFLFGLTHQTLPEIIQKNIEDVDWDSNAEEFYGI